MVRIKVTEREVSAELAEEINKILQRGGYPFKRATPEPSASGRFPDIVLWEDYMARKAFAFWELKPPGQREDLSKLPDKARKLGVSYFITWNFSDGMLYELVGNIPHPLKSYPEPLLGTLEEWRQFPKRIEVVRQAEKMLQDLADLYRQGTVGAFIPDKVYFISLLRNAVEDLYPILDFIGNR
ncbi:MAG: hypothetical protein DRI61_01485 [Chloroflexi bacterium]|nr:MAG: hypothetical protein DRI61_01485 [Chloroflexota bacterium]